MRRFSPRRVLALGVALVLLLAILAPPVHVAVQTLLLLPAAFPGAPVDPLSALTPAPTRTEHHYAYAVGTVDADVYHPGGSGHGGIVLQYQGPRPVPRRDPLLVHFAEGLARLGIVVVVPESSAMLAGRVLPEETDAIRQNFELLAAQPDVDPSRLGFVAFSVGGSLTIVEATRPELRDRVRFVATVGSYYDAAELLVDVASHTLQVPEGQVQPWLPDDLAYQVLAQDLIETLPDANDRDLLTRAFVQHEAVPEADLSRLTPDGATVRQLLSGPSRPDALAAVDRLPPASRARLAALSPSAVLGDLRAHLYLMHDTGDTLVPYPQALRLAAAAPPGTLRRLTLLSIFQHIIPDRPVPWQTFLPDLWAFYWHVDAVLSEVL